LGDKDRVMSSRVFGVLFFLTLVLHCAPPAHSQAAVGPQQQPGQAPTEASAAELQKKVQNPVSNLISVPLQSNIDFGIGPYDRTRNTLNIQPAIPLQLSESVNIIVRTIIPVVLQPDPPTPNQEAFGLGDINPSFLFSPAKPGKLIWGMGPAFLLPTATDRTLG
jgi:hypothetical protein